jgi:hypothetical protein
VEVIVVPAAHMGSFRAKENVTHREQKLLAETCWNTSSDTAQHTGPLGNHPITTNASLWTKLFTDYVDIDVYQGYQKNRPWQQTLQGVYFIVFAATCFGPCWPSSGGIHNYFWKLLYSKRILCFFVLIGPIYCICLANTAVVYLICVYELSKLGQITN